MMRILLAATAIVIVAATSDLVGQTIADADFRSRFNSTVIGLRRGVVAHGRKNPPGPPGAKQGINDFTGWFAGDPAMAGDYYGYDGPCPPWNDDLLHHYHFRVYALDVATLGLAGRFTAAAARSAMQGHVLAEAAITGTYTLNAALRR